MATYMFDNYFNDKANLNVVKEVFGKLLESFGFVGNELEKELNRILRAFKSEYNNCKRFIGGKLQEYKETSSERTKIEFVNLVLKRLSGTKGWLDMYLENYNREDPIRGSEIIFLGIALADLLATVQYGLSCDTFLVSRKYFRQAEVIIESFITKFREIFIHLDLTPVNKRIIHIANKIGNEDHKTLVGQIAEQFG